MRCKPGQTFETVHGVVAILEQVAKYLGWLIQGDLTIERTKGGEIHLTRRDDNLFHHILRQDLRKFVWKTIPAEKKEYGIEMATQGVDYEFTDKLMRAKQSTVKKKTGTKPANLVEEMPGQRERHELHQMTAQQRATACIL